MTLDGEVSAMAVRNEGGGGVRVSPPHMGRAVSCQKRRFSSVKTTQALAGIAHCINREVSLVILWYLILIFVLA